MRFLFAIDWVRDAMVGIIKRKMVDYGTDWMGRVVLWLQIGRI